DRNPEVDGGGEGVGRARGLIAAKNGLVSGSVWGLKQSIRMRPPREDVVSISLNFARIFAAAFILGWLAAPAPAQETLKVAAGQRGNWDTSVCEIGQRGGIFKKHGIELDIVYTQGSGETLQAVLSESVDIGVAVGIMGALGAYSKGAPVRVIGAETTGAGDLYWYVKGD